MSRRETNGQAGSISGCTEVGRTDQLLLLQNAFYLLNAVPNLSCSFCKQEDATHIFCSCTGTGTGIVTAFFWYWYGYGDGKVLRIRLHRWIQRVRVLFMYFASHRPSEPARPAPLSHIATSTHLFKKPRGGAITADFIR
jgi:hypothetical protein